MKKLVIFGTSGVAKELRYFAETDGYEVVAYVLDRCYITECKFDGRPLIAYEELADHYKRDEIALLIMTGYSNMNDNRKDILERCRNDGWQTPSFIHSSVLNLSKSVGIGNIIFPISSLFIFIGTAFINLLIYTNSSLSFENIPESSSHNHFLTDGKTAFQPVHPADTAALHSGSGNYVHTDTLSHAQACLRFYNAHPANVAGLISSLPLLQTPSPSGLPSPQNYFSGQTRHM